MKRIAYKMVWMISVFAMLLINNSVLFAQSTEGTTTIIQIDQNSVDAQQQNDDSQSQASITELYLCLNNFLPLDLVNSESNGPDNIYLNNNGTTVWGPVAVSGSNFYDIDTIIPVSSTSSVRLELFDKNSGRSLGKVSFSFNTLKKIIENGERYYTFSHKWYSSATWKYKLNYEVKSTNSSSSDFSARAQAASIPQLSWPCSARGINLYFGDDWSSYATKCTNLQWKHTGIDINASAGSAVYAAEAGTVRVSQSSNSDWQDWITIEHKDSRGNKYTTVYWHLKNRKVQTYDKTKTVTRGQQIAEVADWGSRSHLHFGVRNASYSNTSNRGGLPTTKCSASGMTSADVWQANFVNPLDYLP